MTGPRPAEALGLRWDDIDFSDLEFGVVHVSGQVTWVTTDTGKVPWRKGVKAERREARTRFVVFPALVIRGYLTGWCEEHSHM